MSRTTVEVRDRLHQRFTTVVRGILAAVRKDPFREVVTSSDMSIVARWVWAAPALQLRKRKACSLCCVCRWCSCCWIFESCHLKEQNVFSGASSDTVIAAKVSV